VQQLIGDATQKATALTGTGVPTGAVGTPASQVQGAGNAADGPVSTVTGALKQAAADVGQSAPAAPPAQGPAN
jgi:hypothetical protein